jgi:Spy/CpxP family protein refolding chaperone
MNYFDKSKLLLWVVVFFLVINITALVTFFVYFSNAGRQVQVTSAGQTCGQVCRMLDLTEEQSKNVEAIQADFREKADPVIGEIRENRRLIVEELSKDVPDTSLVNRYANSIGELHKQLQKTAAGQFLSLKKVCNPEQCRKLSDMYYDLYGCKGQGEKMMHGKGKQHRLRGGN